MTVESLGVDGTSRLAFLKLARLINHLKPRIIHARNFNTWIDALLAWRASGSRRASLVLGFHGLEQPGFSAKQKTAARLLGLRRLTFATVAKHGSTLLQEELGVDPSSIQTIPNGVDTDHFAPASEDQRATARRDLGLDRNPFVVAMVGALTPIKDHETGLRAVQTAAGAMGDHAVLIAGSGRNRDRLAETTRQTCPNLNVRFLGQATDVRRVLWASDALISSSRFEQSSNAILEAMACGLPIVATDAGGTREIVLDRQSGFLAPVGDAGALGRSLRELAADGDLRRRMGRSARERVTRLFRIEQTASAYARFYDRLLTPTPSQGQAPCAASPALLPTSP